MRVIGTAGHVDHGKSTLVRRLTGIDPDRLIEEKKREMTIDLGFAWLEMASGETLGIVDVPGHRDFIENMLAGIGGIDAVLLIIAADEGVMPQTREHLAIIDLLGIQHGLVALTKIDMVADQDWLDLVQAEIAETLLNTALHDAPIIPVSAYTGEGIPNLLDNLEALLSELPQRTNYNHPRLPIDRVFTMDGFGTIVTGTLSGGTFQVGDDIEIQPSGLKARIRGLQSYQQSVQTALPGSRVAVNVAGINKSQINRGDMLSYSGQLHATVLFDAQLNYLADSSRPLKHNDEVKLFVGASESVANVRLLSHEMLQPGEIGWIQLRTRDSIPVSQGDRFILRYPSPAETIGGGVIVNPYPGKRWKRFQAHILQELEIRLQGSPAERIAQAADQQQPVKTVHLQQATGYDATNLSEAIQEALAQNLIVEFEADQYMSTARMQTIQAEIVNIVTDYHKRQPLRVGISREELRNQADVKSTTLTKILSMTDGIVVTGNLVKLADHEIRFTPRQQEQIKKFNQELAANPYTPPAKNDALAFVDESVLYALVDMGEIVSVQEDIIFTRNAYHAMVQTTLELIDRDGSVDAKTLRDQFQTSRKYAIGLLEHLDAQGITRRDGDVRVRGNKHKTESRS